jgi:hypothetical protein
LDPGQLVLGKLVLGKLVLGQQFVESPAFVLSMERRLVG